MEYRPVAFDEKLPLTLHLAEIRYRLIRIILFTSFLFVICFSLSENILQIIHYPIKGYNLIFITPTEAFFVHLKLAFITAITLEIPFILYHVWVFIAPGLRDQERKYSLPFLFFSLISFFLGVFFAYFVILPFGLTILLKFATNSLIPDITISYYIDFVFQIFLIFGMMFEIPVIMILLTKTGIVNPELLKKNHKYAILIIFIVSAILTPPDVFTQLLMAIPLLLLYELSVLLSKKFYRKKEEREALETNV